jgi:hypothetical protein
VRGIGPKALAEIERALADRGLSLAADEWDRYKCARDGEPTWDTALESLYLCEPCAATFERGPFAGTRPVYVGGDLDGYCASCNELKRVRLHQWFLCGICSRVTRSIGRGVIAARFVIGHWNQRIRVQVPELELVETDPPMLRRRTRQAQATAGDPDLTAFDRRKHTPVLGIELKSGRSSVGPGGVGARMDRFQLDQSDCDDIEESARKLRTIIYLLHVQVLDRAEPPTTRFAAVDFWWSDMFSMRDHFQDLKQRPRENRPAAYFDVRMFKPGATFAEHINSGDHVALTERIREEGVPALYARR